MQSLGSLAKLLRSCSAHTYIHGVKGILLVGFQNKATNKDMIGSCKNSVPGEKEACIIGPLVVQRPKIHGKEDPKCKQIPYVRGLNRCLSLILTDASRPAMHQFHNLPIHADPR